MLSQYDESPFAEWCDEIIRSKNYSKLVDYLSLTLFSDGSSLEYPSLDTVQVLLTLATISPHYHHGLGLVTQGRDISHDNALNVGVRLARYLSSLVLVLRASDDLNNFKLELFKVLAKFNPEATTSRTGQLRRRQLITSRLRETRKMDYYAPQFPLEEDDVDDIVEEQPVEKESSVDSSEEEELEATPLKRQMDLLYKNLSMTLPSDEDEIADIHAEDGVDRGGADEARTLSRKPVKRRKQLSRSETPDLSSKENEVIFGNRILYQQLNRDFWNLVRWSLKNASSSTRDLKSLYIWRVWRPVVTFLVDVALLEVDFYCQDLANHGGSLGELLLEQLEEKSFISTLLARSLSMDQALREFVENCFTDLNAKDVVPIYKQETHRNHRLVMVNDLEHRHEDPFELPVSLGFHSMPLRKKLLYLAFYYLRADTATFERSSNEYISSIKSHLVQLSYREFIEFFTEDPTLGLRPLQIEFLVLISISVLKHYQVMPKSKTKSYLALGRNLIRDPSFAAISDLQRRAVSSDYLDSVMESEGTFTTFFQGVRRTAFCLCIVINSWFQVNDELPAEKLESILSQLQIGDRRRDEMILRTFQTFKRLGRLSANELEYFSRDKMKVASLSEMVGLKFDMEDCLYPSGVEDSQ